MASFEPEELNSNCRRLKIVLLGDRSVGKSSIIRRFTNNNFQDTMNPTVGVDFMTKQTKYKNLNYKFELWDTAGQEKYRSLVKGYLKGADVCILVYDATRIDSYEALVEWIHIFDSVSSFDALKLVARNKSDLQEEPQESFEKQKKKIKQKYKQLQEMNEMAISAKTGSNIEEMFEQILHQCWFSKTMLDIGTSKTIKSVASEKHSAAIKQRYGSCCS